jgi:hypothetical protein
MMLFPTAIRRDFASMIFRYGPAVVALVYPLALAALHLSGQHFVRATETTNRLLAGFAIFLAAALVYPVPLISFTVISRSDRPRERSLAHLAFAAPPLFTLTGVAFFLVGTAEAANWPLGRHASEPGFAMRMQNSAMLRQPGEYPQ